MYLGGLGIMTLLVVWWGISGSITSSYAMLGNITLAWWGVRMVAASPPAMPQVIPMGGMERRCWRPGGISDVTHLLAAWWGGVAGGSALLCHRWHLVGGLVGITSSYATGDPDGGDGSDYVGGLVGQSGGTITSSYATGDPDGGAGVGDRVVACGDSVWQHHLQYATGSLGGRGLVTDWWPGGESVWQHHLQLCHR